MARSVSMAVRRYSVLRMSYRFCDRQIGTHITKYPSRDVIMLDIIMSFIRWN